MVTKVEIFYEAKCKHCKFLDTKKWRSFCKLKNILIRKKDKVCKDFKLL